MESFLIYTVTMGVWNLERKQLQWKFKMFQMETVCKGRPWKGFLISKLFFKTPGSSNPSSHTRTISTNHNYPKSFTKLVAGTATIFALKKQSKDFATGKQHFKALSKHDHFSAVVDHVKTTGHNINGTILTFWRSARLTTTAKLRRPCRARRCDLWGRQCDWIWSAGD